MFSASFLFLLLYWLPLRANLIFNFHIDHTQTRGTHHTCSIMAFSQDIGPAATGPPAPGLAVSKLWSLDRYARFIPIERTSVLQNVTDKPSNGKWQVSDCYY